MNAGGLRRQVVERTRTSSECVARLSISASAPRNATSGKANTPQRPQRITKLRLVSPGSVVSNDIVLSGILLRMRRAQVGSSR